VLRVIKYEVFLDKPWLLQTKERNGNEKNWQYHHLGFREKGQKAVQCLTTSDDTTSRLHQIQISKSIYSTHISSRNRYKLKKLMEETNPTSTEVPENI